MQTETPKEPTRIGSPEWIAWSAKITAKALASIEHVSNDPRTDEESDLRYRMLSGAKEAVFSERNEHGTLHKAAQGV